MWSTDLVPPVAKTHGNHGQLRQNNGSSDGGCHLLRALDSQTNMAVTITHGHKRLEPGTLAGTGLLLDWHNLEHFILQRVFEEEIDDLRLLDGDGKQIDILESLDLTILHQTTKLSYWDPL